jgi:hypothetical protein
LTDYEGNKLKEDNGWGDKTASAFGKYHFGLNTKVKNSKDLWMKLRIQKRDVGNSYNLNKLIKEIVEIINYKESPTTGVQDFLSDLIGGEDGVGISSDNLKGYFDRFTKYTSTKLHDIDEIADNELYEKHIKTKEDGNKFREWVHNNPKRLEYIEDDLKSIGITDGFSKTGPIDNIHFLIAWDSAGKVYLQNTVREYMTDDMWYEKIMDNLGEKLESDLQKRLQTFKNNYKSKAEYKNYQKAVSNWNSVSKSFFWDEPKIFNLDGTNITKLNEVTRSTCINPTWLLTKIFIIESKLSFLLDGTYLGHGGTIYKLDSNTNLGGITDYEQAKEYLEKEFIDSWGQSDEEYTANRFTPNSDPFNQRALWGPNDSRKREEDRQKVLAQFDQKRRQSLLKAFKLRGVEGNDGLELLVVRNNYLKFLETINNQNILIGGQRVDELKRVGERSVSTSTFAGVSTMAEQIAPAPIITPNIITPTETITVYFNMRNACKNYGGAFLYYDPKEKNAKNKYVCCVKDVDKKVTVYGTPGSLAAWDVKGKTFPVGVNLNDYCKVENIQSDSEWWADKAENCITDWHCWADIISIVATFFGPVGIVVASVVDGISALGYVVEGDEGWKLNAGLTAIGIIPGFGEVSKFVKGGSKNIKALQKIGDAVKGLDGIEAQIKLQKMVSELPKDVKKSVGEFLEKGVKEIKDNEDLLKKIFPSSDEISKLSAWEKDLLEKQYKNLSPAEFTEKLYKYDGDIKKMLGALEKSKDVIKVANVLQLSLFGGLYLGGEKIGESLKKLYDSTGWDPFGLFDEIGGEENNEPQIDWDIINKDIGSGIQDLMGNPEDFEKRIQETSDIIVEYQRIVNKIKEEHKEHVGISELCDEIYKYPEKKLRGAGIGLEIVDISKDILKVSKEIAKLDNETDIYNRLVDYVNEIYDLKIEKLTNTQKEMQLLLNDPDLSKEKSEEMLNNINDMINDMYDNNMDESVKDMKLNEEINRIKSLFSDDRLYGNLVNEVCDDVDDAIKFLTDNGYVVKQQSEHDLCIGPSTKLGKAYKYLKDNHKILITKFKIRVENYGSTCGLTFTDTTKDGFYIITLFENTDGDLQFNSFYLLKDDKSDVCKQTFTLGGADYDVYLSGKLSDSTVSESYLGGKYIKIGGLWKLDSGGKPILYSSGLEGIFNEKVKTIKTTLKIPGTAIEIPIPGTDASVDGGTKEWMDNSGTCQTVSDFVVSVLGWNLSSNFDLTSYLEKIK